MTAETAVLQGGDPGQTVQLTAGGQAVTAGPGGGYQTVTLVPSDGNSDEVSYVLIVQVSWIFGYHTTVQLTVCCGFDFTQSTISNEDRLETSDRH